ncbi:putative peptidoglycan binding protein [Marinilabilia salmonicolor]|jgi:lysozyme family protein|uniref:glycoside hydrolase family 108 protein n=1 Tax=Marinilabilia salmonicolor TaxID=989 RepID=UPI000D06F434|nr:glycosyl hydrolase 108 family protein [Marinilabilia salmonicolor]PRY98864.1 putative peptidoglycan binding protein [Marinilabilia salmonicolor]
MAIFEDAFNKTLIHEGGYVNDPDDLGGETYKGIARNIHPDWTGWRIIDRYKQSPGFPDTLGTDVHLPDEVRQFYKNKFWNKIKGDAIQNQLVADSIFDFSVNSGIKTGISIAQKVLDVAPDGIIGPITLKALNNTNPDLFLASYTIAKIARYVHLVKIRPANRKFFFGWIRRAIGDI